MKSRSYHQGEGSVPDSRDSMCKGPCARKKSGFKKLNNSVESEGPCGVLGLLGWTMVSGFNVRVMKAQEWFTT